MKKIIAIILLCSFLTLLSACGKDDSSSATQPSSSSSTASTASTTAATETNTQKPTEIETEATTEAPTQKETEKVLTEKEFDETTSFVYTNERFNYSLTFPAEWRKTLAIEEQANSEFVSFSYLGAFEDPSVGAILFSIHIMDKSEYDPNSNSLFPKYKYVAESSDKVALCIYPTDVQYDPTNIDGEQAYKAYQAQIDSILSTFKFN